MNEPKNSSSDPFLVNYSGTKAMTVKEFKNNSCESSLNFGNYAVTNAQSKNEPENSTSDPYAGNNSATKAMIMNESKNNSCESSLNFGNYAVTNVQFMNEPKNSSSDPFLVNYSGTKAMILKESKNNSCEPSLNFVNYAVTNARFINESKNSPCGTWNLGIYAMSSFKPRNLFKKIALLFLLLPLLGCEEVVDVDLEESAPRLVIEASLLWDFPQARNPLTVRLSTTAPYFEEEIPPATGAQVRVFDAEGTQYEFRETEPGLYLHEGFVAEEGESFQLEVIYEDQVYQATESLVTTPQIDFIEQNDEGGFSGDEIELRAFYTDPAGKGDYYFFRFFHDELSIQIYEDELIDGNQSFASFSNEDLEAGDEVFFELQSISRGFYDYLFILRSQAGSGGGPFQTQPTIVRGNIVNTTNKENFAFGYFRLSQRVVRSYVIE